MAHTALSALLALASLTLVAAQTTPAPTQTTPAGSVPTFPVTPLSEEPLTWGNLPYQAVSNTYVRGTQSGYNICNSTTQNQNSECQTMVVNNISDFCIFAPPQPNSTISDTEAIEVAYCVKEGWGTRGIPPGTITGVQVLNNPNYVQIVAFIDQVKLNMQANDYGGELDGGGQDTLGNPMGGVVGSNGFGLIERIPNWNSFIGGGLYAVKVCAPNGTNPAGYCQHTLDRIGIAYNMPNNAVNGTFEVCDTDAMQIPGEYVVNGVTSSYAQPAESVPITSVPYTPIVPASSNCVTYHSTDLYTDFLNLAASTATSASSSPTGTGAGNGAGTRSGSGAAATATSGSNGAGAVTISVWSGILGVAFSIAFLS